MDETKTYTRDEAIAKLEAQGWTLELGTAEWVSTDRDRGRMCYQAVDIFDRSRGFTQIWLERSDKTRIAVLG